MPRYVAGRLAQALVVITGVTLAVFVILRSTAGDPARISAGTYESNAVVKAYQKQFGTSRTLLHQLGDFVSGLAHGDLGTSFRYQRPVTALIAERLPKTLELGAVALTISVTLALVVGVLAAARPGSPIDRAATALAALGQSAPTFWIALLLSLVFAVNLKLFPATGYSGFSSLVLPAIAVAFGTFPAELRVLRASMRQVLREDYIRTAKAFGQPAWRIHFVYALRNGCLPLLSVIGVDLGYILGGVIVAEAVFNFPGIGSLAVTGLAARDYPVIQGVTIVTAAMFVLANLAIDLLYTVIDPRIRLRESR